MDSSLFICRLTFLICSVGFTSPLLFDERKQLYHLMLHKFFACGAQQTFFEYFIAFYYSFIFNVNSNICDEDVLLYWFSVGCF